MNWNSILNELKKTSPDAFELMHIEANPVYDWNGVRQSVDYDAIIFDFTGIYNRYKATIRVSSDSSVTAMIEIKDGGVFEYPITPNDEHFEDRVETYGPQIMKNDLQTKTEVKLLYYWSFSAYRNLLQ